jgi:hypothetical protein
VKKLNWVGNDVQSDNVRHGNPGVRFWMEPQRTDRNKEANPAWHEHNEED